MQKRSFHFWLTTACFLFQLFIFSSACKAQGGEYRVWVKTSPCSGRFDWISISKTDPTIPGLSFYSAANIIFPGTGCTTMGCTFDVATALANSMRPSPVFSQYCCRDYSVWRQGSTGKLSIVQGKFGTAGEGWMIEKADLCCEEAEAYAGLTGACSGGTITPPPVQCYPGSHPAVDPQTGKTLCYCNTGLVWNATKTACIKPKDPAQITCFPGSHPAVDPQTGKTLCYCDEGLVWNATRTACVTQAINCFPGSHPATDPATGKTLCYCDEGLVWNDTKTACVTPAMQCYPGSHPAVDPATGKTLCYCDAGLVWNDTKTACVTPAMQCYPGSHPAVDPATGKTLCYCDAGLVWNATKTACVTPGNNGGGGGATWVLVSTVSRPERPGQGWGFSNGAAHLDVYQGDKADFTWTPPPASFGKDGFTVTLTANAQPVPKGRMAVLIGVKGYPLDSPTPPADRQVYVTTEDGRAANGSRSVTFRPSGTPDQIEVEVGLMWGGLIYTYKYKKQ